MKRKSDVELSWVFLTEAKSWEINSPTPKHTMKLPDHVLCLLLLMTLIDARFRLRGGGGL